jgi:hypothetical protein
MSSTRTSLDDLRKEVLARPRHERRALLKELQRLERKKSGPQRPDEAIHATTQVIGHMWQGIIPISGLLYFTLEELKARQGKRVDTPYGSEEVTPQALEKIKRWRLLSLKEVVAKVQDRLATDLDELQPLSITSKKQRLMKEKHIRRLERILRYHDARLMPYVRDEAIRYLLTVNATWQEMPNCLIDNRQTWLGKKDKIGAFHQRQQTLHDYQGSYTREEFDEREAASEAFLSKKDLTN